MGRHACLALLRQHSIQRLENVFNVLQVQLSIHRRELVSVQISHSGTAASAWSAIYRSISISRANHARIVPRVSTSIGLTGTVSPKVNDRFRLVYIFGTKSIFNLFNTIFLAFIIKYFSNTTLILKILLKV